MKRIVLAVTFAVALAAGVKALPKSDAISSENNPPTLKIAFPYQRPIDSYDPIRITLAPEYVLLENLYSPLVRLDKEGDVTSALALTYEWLGQEAHFTIRQDAQTFDGTPITALDAAVTLKRAIILTQNTHGNLKDLLCRNTQIKNLSEECPGIEVRGNTLVLKPGKRSSFLFPMLASADFGIIPKDSIDPVSCKIKDYKQTSGSYFVETDKTNGDIVLRANPKHFDYKPTIPQVVKIVPTDPKNPSQSFELLKTGKVDLLTTVDAAQPDAVLGFAKSHPNDFNVHQTFEVRTLLLAFSEKGLKKFSPDERIAIGKQVRNHFTKYAKTIHGYRPTTQFYPTFGVGGLTLDQKKALDTRFAKVKSKKFSGRGLKANLVRVGRKDVFTKILTDVLPGISVSEGRNPNFVDYSKNPEEMPDIFISAPDAGALEDIGLISYSFNAGYSAVPKNERVAWLNSYIAEPDANVRLMKLKNVHFKTLISPIIIPLATSPYVSIANKNWIFNYSRHYGSSPLWQLASK